MANDMFQRTEMLLGADAMRRLAKARVAVFGLGGVGSYAVEALARSGVGSLALFDGDVVEESNLNRQLFATRETLGIAKARVAAARVRSINPDCRVEARQVFYTPENAENFTLEAYGYIVDAVDMVSAKLELAERAWRVGVPIISSMGAGNKLDPLRFEVADVFRTEMCPLARVMRRELKRRGVPALKVVYSREAPRNVQGRVPGSVAFVPSVAGLVIAGEVVRSIASGGLETS